ncbi:MAG: hypothetical protein CWE10_16490 [Symbiobacterium thermophilum]|uniref:histidine kinase n=2 Tax=Symbiobacterium thermophilum TaxID=2734 RepID=A0A953IB37_SYMTR|nr:hypothetical protein [Symbiobacterium thermophilum]
MEGRMEERRTLGLQWQLVAVTAAAGLLASGLAVFGVWVALQQGFGWNEALVAGVAAGVAGGLAAAAWSFQLARGIKRRLWNAGDLAARIRRGDLSARLPVSDADEIGELEMQLNEMAAYLEQAVGQLSRLAEQNRLLAEEAGRGAALEERARIARDLHDTVNQQLFVLSLRAAAVRKRVGAASGAAAGGDGAGVEPQLVTELANLEELARAAHSQIRELILQLRPTTLEQHGLGPALAEYVKTVAERENWAVENEIDQALRLRGAEGEALFRVAQEALNNVAKHARASRIRVVLERAGEGEIRLLVADDGVGFDRRAGIRPTAVGLAGMHERMAALGGSIQVRSAPGEGTEVLAVLPPSPPRGEGGGP